MDGAYRPATESRQRNGHTVSRASYAVAASSLLAACATIYPDSERVRVERIETAVLPMASAALTAGQVETARRVYTRLLEVDPGSADARMGLGDVALANRETAQAARWYLASVAHADRPEARHAALLAHGRAALAIGDLDAARSSFARLTAPDENASQADTAWGFNGIGVVSLLQGNPRDAVTAMEQAVLRLPNEPMFQGNLDRALKIVANYPPPEPAVETDMPAEVAPDAPPITKPAGEPEPAPPDLASPAAQEFSEFLPRAFVVRTDEGLYLQVGAFAAKASATNMASRLRGRTDLPIRIHANADTGDSLFRVQIGPLPPGKLAAGLAAALRVDGDALATVDTGSDVTSTAEPPVATTPSHVVEDGSTFVEVGSYPDYDTAAAVASELELRTGHPVETSKVRLAGTPAVYRVRVGPVGAEAASTLVEMLAETR